MSTWTVERIERARVMWHEGKPASEIAAALGGVSRNAVIGQIHRRGWAARTVKVRKAIPPDPRGRAKPRRANYRIKKARGIPKPPRPIVEPPRSPRACEPVRMADLGSLTAVPGQCRWIRGEPDGPNTLCCGAARKPKNPYCEFHSDLAFAPTPSRSGERRLGEYLSRISG